MSGANVSISAELEEKMQELYSANCQIERLTATVAYLEQECECLKDDQEEKARELEIAKKSDMKAKDEEIFRERILELEERLDESQNKEKELKEEVALLQRRLEIALEASAPNVSITQDPADELIALSGQVVQLEQDKLQLQTELEEIKSALQKEMTERTNLQRELSDKDEEIYCIESQFSTQCSISESLREENQQLKAQLESEMGQVDLKRKGNSLFSEVDDRRQAAESKVVKVQEQMSEMEERLTRETRENKRLKNQVAFLRQSAKKCFDEDTVKSLQDQVVQSKKSIVELTERLCSLEGSNKSSAIQNFRPSATTSDDDKQYINFLEGIIRTKTKEVTDAQAQMQRTRLDGVRTELQLTQANNEVMSSKHEISQLRMKNSHLAMTLNNLQHKYGEVDESVSPYSRKQNNKNERDINKGAPTSHILTPVQKKGEDVDTSKNQTQQTASWQTGKENVRLRDLFDIKDSPSEKSKGVHMMSEVKVISSKGEESSMDLKEDGLARKPKRGTEKGRKGKFNTVTYTDASQAQPSECKQQ